MAENHAAASELWLIFYKKSTGKKYLPYEEAVQEALCFGWIDSKVRKIDEEKFMQKYTPRKDKSLWADSNKKRVKKLIQQGLMTQAGLNKIEIAKQNGSWEIIDEIEKIDELPEDLHKALRKNKKAEENFGKFTPSQKKQYLWWLLSAKKEETRKKRVEEIVRRSAENIKPGM